MTVDDGIFMQFECCNARAGSSSIEMMIIFLRLYACVEIKFTSTQHTDSLYYNKGGKYNMLHPCNNVTQRDGNVGD